MKKIFVMITVILLAVVVGGAGTVAMAAKAKKKADPGLVERLTRELGVTQKQATGGAGAVFNTAKKNMTKKDFGKVTKAVPDINKMMAAAPKADEAESAVVSASALLGDSKSTVSTAAGLAASFSKLDMDAGMVNAFIPIILGYVQEKGGEVVMTALQNALK